MCEAFGRELGLGDQDPSDLYYLALVFTAEGCRCLPISN